MFLLFLFLYYILNLFLLCVPVSLHIRQVFSFHHFHACSATCFYTSLTLFFKRDKSKRILCCFISLICNKSVTTTVSKQQCHNNSVKTTVSQQQCHNSVTTTVSQQQCHNSVTTTVSQVSQQQCRNNSDTTSVTTTVSQQQCHNSVATTVSQQQCRKSVTTVSQRQCHNSKFVIFQEKCLKVLKCYNLLSATTTLLPSSSEFCRLLYDTIPVKSSSVNVSFYYQSFFIHQLMHK